MYNILTNLFINNLLEHRIISIKVRMITIIRVISIITLSFYDGNIIRVISIITLYHFMMEMYSHRS